MPTYLFKGRMLPRQIELTLDHEPKVSVTGAETIPDTVFTLSVNEGAIRIEAETDDAETDVADDLFFFAQDLARTAAEVATIADGVAYVPQIESVVRPDGEERGLVLANRQLGALMTVFASQSSEDVFELVATDVALMRVLSDVAVMLTWGHYAPIAAGRVAENILRMLTGGRSPDDWSKMRDILRVDRPYLQLLTDRAVAPRHGNREYVDGKTNRMLAERSWTLMNRYLAYRLTGGQALDPSAYPELHG